MTGADDEWPAPGGRKTEPREPDGPLGHLRVEPLPGFEPQPSLPPDALPTGGKLHNLARPRARPSESAQDERAQDHMQENGEAQPPLPDRLADALGHRGARVLNARSGPRQNSASSDVYAALDLGTNNCRLLVARPSRRGFFVVDAFSRIIRLGEGVTHTGALSTQAMARTIDALQVCAAKMERNGVTRRRLVATEACRIASNGRAFLDEVRAKTHLELELLSRENEARLAVSGCASLLDNRSDMALIFDIGGGSSELIWLDLRDRELDHPGRPSLDDRMQVQERIRALTSLPVGVVTLAEQFGGQFVDEALFEAMVERVLEMLAPFEAEHRMAQMIANKSVHFLGTSGTVTTLAGIHLRLPRYERRRVDGCWLRTDDVRRVTNGLLAKTFEERVAQPCIGRDRADLVLAGCAILEGLLRLWPCARLRVADRGLREGILAQLMSEDGVYRNNRRRGGAGPASRQMG
ncbi:MAG: Ppx/GppA phosphatase family protein [Pseudomonadota bacterium]